jgi:phosphate:Na+ symporter
MLRTNIVLASDIFSSGKFEEIDGFNEVAAEIDKANASIRSFLTKLHNEALNEDENASIATLLNNLTSLERISNHTKGIVKQAEELRDGKIEHSEETAIMLREIGEKKVLCYDAAIKALTLNEPEHVELAMQGAEEILDLHDDYKAEPTVASQSVLLEALRHISSIASHSRIIAETVPVEDK